MSANERRREERDEEWYTFVGMVASQNLPVPVVQRILKRAVSLARAHAAVVVLDGDYDNHYPFPPEPEEDE